MLTVQWTKKTDDYLNQEDDYWHWHKNKEADKKCHVCGCKIGEHHGAFCSVGNGIFRGE